MQLWSIISLYLTDILRTFSICSLPVPIEMSKRKHKTQCYINFMYMSALTRQTWQRNIAFEIYILLRGSGSSLVVIKPLSKRTMLQVSPSVTISIYLRDELLGVKLKQSSLVLLYYYSLVISFTEILLQFSLVVSPPFHCKKISVKCSAIMYVALIWIITYWSSV